MAAYTFPGQAVVASDDILEDATGGLFVDDNDTVIPIYDVNDQPITTITSNHFGQSSVFKADVPSGWIKFGSVKNFVACKEVVQFALNAQSVAATAATANASAQQALAAANQALALAQSISSSQGVTDHGALSGLLDDDHPQYHNDARGDVRYYTKAQSDSSLNTAVANTSAADRNRANHTGSQTSSSISDFATAVQANVTNRLRFDAAQTLTAPQQAQAKANMGLTNLTGLTIAAARLSTDPVLTDAQALALYGEGAYFTVDP